jgi:hypothetical protein
MASVGSDQPEKRSRTRIALAALLLSLLECAAAAQNSNPSNVFAGYSFEGTNLFSGQHANMSGWNVSAESKLRRFIGVVGDVSGHYGSAIVFNPDCGNISRPACFPNNRISQYYFQFGVRGSYGIGKIRPYAEALVGGNYTIETALGVSNTRVSFAETVAAGLDYHITRRFGWRLEAGWLGSGSTASRQKSLRASTGLVVRF